MSGGLWDCPRPLLANYPSWKWLLEFLLRVLISWVLVSSKSLQPAPRTPSLHEMGAAAFPWEGPHSPVGSVGAWLTSSLLPCHTASRLLLPVWDTQPASEALAASSELQKDNFTMNEGDLLSGGSWSPAVIVLLLYLSLTPAPVMARLCSAPSPMCMLCASAPGGAINSLALLQSLTLLPSPAACGCTQIPPWIAAGPLGWL